MEPRARHYVDGTIADHRAVAFTLVELLIAVAIIAILAGMLLPALKKARDTANKSLCVSNLKQLGVGMAYYLDNYNGWFPTWDYGVAPNPRFWYNFVDYELSGKEASLNSNGLAGTKLSVWICPSNPSHGWGYNDLSYGYNAYLGFYHRDGVVVTQHVHAQKVMRPSGIIMLGDGDGDKDYDSYLGPSYWTAGYRHSMGGNIVFVDQHVDWMRIKDACRPGVVWDGARWNGGTDSNESNRLWGKNGSYAVP